ncbi:MAG TPA: glutathione peroxidase [Holophagaceae bacterium]|nr:glutathione peroxidase [Holophagaceae bacterium]
MRLFDLSTRSLRGEPLPLDTFRGQAVLVVNVASACGYTPQYAGLETLQAAYRDRGFTVLGFPCNQFGGQEPGSADQIEAFCRTTYGTTFPMAAKVDVKGPAQSPVYGFLAEGHGEPQWNFHKYLVGRDGRVIRAFPSSVAPESAELRAAIEAALDQPMA